MAGRKRRGGRGGGGGKKKTPKQNKRKRGAKGFVELSHLYKKMCPNDWGGGGKGLNTKGGCLIGERLEPCG